MNEHDSTDSELPGGGREELLSQTYRRLRALAQSRLKNERAGHTLQATALVHEAWMRLDAEHHSPEDQAGFIAAMSVVMRRVLVDSARRRLARRRGSGVAHEPLTESIQESDSAYWNEVLFVHESLSGLEREDPRAAALVRLRYFAGLTIGEAAAALEISVATAKRDWTKAKYWIAEHMGGE